MDNISNALDKYIEGKDKLVELLSSPIIKNGVLPVSMAAAGLLCVTALAAPPLVLSTTIGASTALMSSGALMPAATTASASPGDLIPNQAVKIVSSLLTESEKKALIEITLTELKKLPQKSTIDHNNKTDVKIEPQIKVSNLTPAKLDKIIRDHGRHSGMAR